MLKKINECGMSIIVPFYNEEEGIEQFCKSIDEFASKLYFNIEIVFVNDGSIDNSLDKIKVYEFKHIKYICILDLSKNFGSHAAIRAGITKAKYDICTWLGSDLQEPLELIPLSYQKIEEEGYDAVYIDKRTVSVSKMNRLFSKVYSILMQKYAVKNYSSVGTSTIVFNKKIKEYLNANIENNSSLMLQIIDAGFHYYEMAMDYHERSVGVSKWSLSKKVKLFIDSFIAFSFMPIRLVSIAGVIIFLIGILIGIITIINKKVNPLVPAGYSTMISILAIGFGITNISIGIIAEYLWRTYDSARNRPAFIIKGTIVIKDNEDDEMVD